jgi:hypothetical protein
MLPPKFEYLFVAEFSDGTKLFQDRQDRSIEQPLTRSAFWDVQQKIARGGKLVRFTLCNRRREHTVFLDDGHFKTDGQIICSPYGQLTNYRVVYFRRCQQVWEDGVLSYPRVTSYFLGWQANDDAGKNFQMALEIAGDGSMNKSNIVNRPS